MDDNLRNKIIYKIDHGKYRDVIEILEELIVKRGKNIEKLTADIITAFKEEKYNDIQNMLENMDSNTIKWVFLITSSPIIWTILWCESHKPFEFLIDHIKLYYISRKLERNNGEIWGTLLTIYDLDPYDKSLEHIKYRTKWSESFWKKLDLIMDNPIWKNTFLMYISDEKNKIRVQKYDKLIQEIKTKYNIQYDLYD